MKQRRIVRDRDDREAGFTLIEILVVLAIIGLVASIASPQLFKQLGKAKTDTARTSLRTVSSGLDMFRLDVGRLPTQQEGLGALLAQPGEAVGWNGPYLKPAQVVDPWKNRFHYRMPGQRGEYDLFSLGADGSEGGSGEQQDVFAE